MQRSLKNILLIFIAVLMSSCQNDNRSEQNPESKLPFSAAYIEHLNEEDESSTAEMDPEESSDLTEMVYESRSNAITNAVEKASSSVVSVMVTAQIRQHESLEEEILRYFFGEPQRDNTNMGSGFIITEDGLVVTNQHVIGNNPGEIVVFTTKGETFEAKLIGSDELTDIALLQIKSDNIFNYIEFSDSDDIMVGEWAIALGNPFGLFDDGMPTVTVGVVSAINRDFQANPNNPRVYIDMIQTDAAINRGNSGGPLLNSDGQLIGVNTFIYTGGTSAGFVGLGFAIPSNRVDRIVSQLLTGGVILLDYDTGMEFTSMTEQLIYRYSLPYVRGLLVTSVNKNGPAYESGVMPGDVIVSIGSERVISEMHAWALLADYDEGDLMYIELIRNGELYKTEMSLRQKVSAE